MRHNARHNKAPRIRHVQRGILLRLLHDHLDKARFVRAESGKEALDWLIWTPERMQRHIEWPTESSARSKDVATSRGLAALERARLVAVQRSEGGRAYRVRLTPSGVDLAFELAEHGGITAASERSRRVQQMPRALRATRTAVHNELRKKPTDEDRRDLLLEYRSLYDKAIGDGVTSDDILELERLQSLLAF